MIDFSCDYNCGCAPEILAALTAANESQHATYGLDAISARAKEKIRAAVGNPDADVFFLVGGTQTNATVLSSILRPWEGVVSAASGHIAVHESGAVEATGHKVLPVEADACGRIEPETLRAYLRGFYADETHPHMVQPGAVYLSHPTEYGGLYSAAALREIRATCDEYGLSLFVDGARLAYALASPETDVTLPLLGELCDVFPSPYIHIGGDECPKERWQKCPKCQAKIKELGLTDETHVKVEGDGGRGSQDGRSPENKLQSYINHEIEQFLAERGRSLIGWDEILEGGISDNAVVMSWRGTKGGVAAAKQKHRVIMSPNVFAYIDHPQLKDYGKQPRTTDSYVVSCSKMYSFDPIVPEELTEEQQDYILGVQANLWTEQVALVQAGEEGLRSLQDAPAAAQEALRQAGLRLLQRNRIILSNTPI